MAPRNVRVFSDLVCHVFAICANLLYNSLFAEASSKKSSSKRVKWADHFGESLSKATLVEGQEVSEEAHDTSVSWSDRKKRDRMREKELLAKVK